MLKQIGLEKQHIHIYFAQTDKNINYNQLKSLCSRHLELLVQSGKQTRTDFLNKLRRRSLSLLHTVVLFKSAWCLKTMRGCLSFSTSFLCFVIAAVCDDC